MGRPAASQENRETGLLFAKAACASAAAAAPDGMVARNGPLSVFGALAACFPAIVRDENGGPRDGLTCMELNKTLQKNGFQRKRNRRSAALNRTTDRFGAGMYLFHMCRWRDPSNESDRAEMQKGYDILVRYAPAFAPACTFTRFCEVIDAIRVQWDPWTGRKKRPAGAAAESLASGLDENDEEENEGEDSDDEDAHEGSQRSESTTETVIKEEHSSDKEQSRKRPHAEISTDEQDLAKPDATPASGSAEEMEKLRQELMQAKAALAMYQLSGAQNPAQPPVATPNALSGISSAFLPLQKEAASTPTSLPFPLVSASLPSVQPATPAMNLSVLQQLLQSPAAGNTPIIVLPQGGLGTAQLAGLAGLAPATAGLNAGLNGLGLGPLAGSGLNLNALQQLALLNR